MSTTGFEPLPQALLALAEPLNWDTLVDEVLAAAGVKRGPNAITLINFSETPIPVRMAYGWFHKRMDESVKSARLLNDVLFSHTDQDRLHFAEDYATSVLEITDLGDATWFRRGVLRKETFPTTRYPKQRDHTIHTLHNYLLGWYFFVHNRKVNEEFVKALASRRLRTTGDGPILNFGQMWCFASLLHDIGYLFEGEIPNESLALIDPGIREGVDWASEYFQDRFWDEWKLRGVDERKAARALAGFEAEHSVDGGPGRIVQFLRDLGPLSYLEQQLEIEAKKSKIEPPKLNSDAFRLWAANYRAFDNPAMAERIEGLEEALYSLFQTGIPGVSVKVLDHGITGGLLLLKYSTYWFRFYFALQRAAPEPGSPAADVQAKLKSQVEQEGVLYRAMHWWDSVIWATAAVALHNVQQSPKFPGWKSRLHLSEDPLAYLGILVDILQEWDRHSARRIPSIESDRRIINSGDVTIGKGSDDKISIRYGCRDGNAGDRQRDLEKALNAALADWDHLVEFSFHSL